MVSKSAIVLSVFAATAQIAVATPPACLLAAVNTQPDPWNLANICGDQSQQVVRQLQNLCGGGAQAAMSAFQQTCKGAGHAVADMPMSSGSMSTTSSKAAHTPTNLYSYPADRSSQMAGPTGSSGAGYIAPTGTSSVGSSAGSSSNGTSYSANPSSVAQPSLGSGAATSSAPSSQSTGAAGRTESQGLAGLVMAAAGLVFLL